MNSKFLNEAREWNVSDRFDRKSCAVLLESQRFQYEFETDDEYEEYLENFNDRVKFLDRQKYKNYWLEVKNGTCNPTDNV